MRFFKRLPLYMLAVVSCDLIAVETPADRIFHSGTVLTMNDALPRAEAIAVRDGIIVAVGNEAEVMSLKGADTEVVDLDGAALLPGFIDSHGHVVNGGLQALAANMLAPPMEK